ncbi:MAG: type I DNA topoisomerase [Terracidiphilus sp.]|nr:type I DNA topoisomerase [Terracidiphilus sp.]MDR3775746.1 type I DNA topoisomerase [Terracidiphilus sp.]
MNLMIVESPNKVKKIKTLLGPGWDVAASVGHVRDLPQKTLGVNSPDYQLQYEFTERGKGVVDGLKSRASKAEAVYLATDPDREGEAIAWHLKESLKLKSYQRVTFDAITEAVVQKALKQPRQLDMNLVHAQEARRGADRLVGYKVSPALSRQSGIARMSAGRVQTVAVRLVVERQREIENFKTTKHFGAEAIFEDGKWTAQWDTAPFLKKGEKYIMDSALAEQAAQCRAFKVVKAATKQAKQAPPAPFTTSTLLQAASVTLGYKPDQAAQLAQKLFEQGLITYHRTDSQNFSAEALTEIRAFAQANNLPIPAKARTFKSKASAQEAHEAIRPTHLEARSAGETEAERKLYGLIWNRAVASQLADAEYSVNTLRLESEQGEQKFFFKSTGRTLVVPGWRGLTAQDAAEDADEHVEGKEDDNGKVPALEVGSELQSTSTRLLNKQTKPPNGYTQAGLIKKLESEGIGRPSTYPAILKNVITRGYLTEGKKILFASDLAKLLIDSLTGKFKFVEYDYTRSLEQELDDIASGKALYLTVVSALDTQLNTELSQFHIERSALAGPLPEPGSERQAGPPLDANRPGIPCPKCKVGRLRRPEGRDFFGCDQFRQGCNFIVGATVAKKPLTDEQIEALCTKGKTELIKGFTSKLGRPFDAYLVCSETTEWKTKFQFEQR